MVGHGFQFEYVASGFLADFSYYLFEPFVHGSGVSVDWRIVEFRVKAGYHLSPVFRTPHDVVVASVGHVVVVFHFVHLSHVCHYMAVASYK